MTVDEMTDALYRILKQHSAADNGPYLSERKNVGTEYEFVTVDGHLALRRIAADLIRAMEPVL
jgi:hypothetical protein